MIAKFDLPGITFPHSCFPNCVVNSRNEIVLFKPVIPGEKLTIDYSTLYVGEEILENCKCGCNGCRGIILGFRYLPVIYQDFYLENDAVCAEVLTQINAGYHFPGHFKAE